MKYSVDLVTTKMVEDSWENGEIGRPWFDVFSVNYSNHNIKALIDCVCEHYNLKRSAAVIYDDEVLVNGTVDILGNALSSDKKAAWKLGKFKAYTLTIRFRILTTIEHDDLIKLTGIKSYD